jgi:hypothetical protein
MDYPSIHHTLGKHVGKIPGHMVSTLQWPPQRVQKTWRVVLKPLLNKSERDTQTKPNHVIAVCNKSRSRGKYTGKPHGTSVQWRNRQWALYQEEHCLVNVLFQCRATEWKLNIVMQLLTLFWCVRLIKVFIFPITSWEWKSCEQSRNVNMTPGLVSAKQTWITTDLQRFSSTQTCSRKSDI